MKKIYITALHLSHGGVEKVISSMANLFIDMDYEVEILCTYYLSEPVYPINNKVIINYLTDLAPNRDEFRKSVSDKKVMNILKNGLYALKVLYYKKSTMKNAFRNIDNSIIISTRNEHSILLSKYSNDSNHNIAQLHHDHKFDKNLIKDLRRKYGGIDHLLLLTPRLKDEVETFIKGYNDNIECLWVPNFIDKYNYPRLLKKTNQILAVGRLHSDKGFDRLLYIWSLYKKNNTDFTLKIIGEGELRNDLEDLASELGITDSVIFSGFLEHSKTIEEMSTSFLYVMTSISEGFPMVLLESMAQGTPAIAFDVRVGPEAIIENGKDGILVEDGDFTSFSNSLLELTHNRDKVHNMSEMATLKAHKYSVDSVREIWSMLLLEK